MAIGLLALLDDITTLLDDIAVLSKVAAKKTVGVLGDDLALNAEQVSGVSADRELPVVWAVAKGSFINKAIIVPFALAISAFLPWLIQPMLMLGGLYLCFEGVEKVLESITHYRHKKTIKRTTEEQQANSAKPALSATELKTLEKSKIRGAIRTDFVLSAEIIVIALGIVENQTILIQAIVVSLIALVVTVGVYALVGLIVRLDDIGLHLFQSQKTWVKTIGSAILQSAPWLIRILTIVGTIAMFLVGGGIFVHGLPPLHHIAEMAVSGLLDKTPFISTVVETLISITAGVILGGTAVGIWSIIARQKTNH